MENLRKTITKGLQEYTGLITIDTDNFNKLPKYPFYSFKFITLQQNDNISGEVIEREIIKSSDEKFKYDVKETMYIQPFYIISFNAYSDNIIESQKYISMAWDWFKFVSKENMEDINVVVVDVSNITDRTLYVVDHYEYRQGFDIRLRQSKKIETIKANIENYKIERG